MEFHTHLHDEAHDALQSVLQPALGEGMLVGLYRALAVFGVGHAHDGIVARVAARHRHLASQHVHGWLGMRVVGRVSRELVFGRRAQLRPAPGARLHGQVLVGVVIAHAHARV